MLGKWLKMGHGKGFRTFQEQSIQRASLLIYEICVPVVWVTAVCVFSMCVSGCVDLYVCEMHTCMFGAVCNSLYTRRWLFMLWLFLGISKYVCMCTVCV